ncbi:MAG: hypothetical protein KYX69_01370 [Sphingomonas sp.]|uniref:hypothetical protein n=1 Tax=Sphingomonas sp. TaxID=28214 RepID=UPI0026119CE6|nr:hypothetical protein [Sphingomonas sp.]MDK2766345.1 hypothetical protein [Sphingomonas sp.]
MATFVHLTSHRNLPGIRRGGIAFVKRDGWRPDRIYALPVTREFNIAHQWLRELRRMGGGTIAGVYFRIPDDEMVEVSHYNGTPVTMRAAEAVALMLAAEQRDPAAARAADKASKAVQRGRALPSSPEGFQVTIARPIARSEILRFKMLPQVTGWRYMPGANGTAPCGCVCCMKGSFGVRKLERRLEADEAAGRTSKVQMFGREEASFARVARLRARAGRD